MKQLRDYQAWCIDGNDRFPGINKALQTHHSAIAVMATGLGKTVVEAKVANDWKRGNTLCLVHRIELVDQIAQTLGAELGYMPAVEQGTRGVDMDLLWHGGAIVVGSIQSMISERRVEKFRRHPFGLIIIDECHRAVSASYVSLVDRYRALDPELRVLGFTATPNRTDKTAMGLVFGTVAFEMGIVDGIDTGWLVDIRQKFAVLNEVDFGQVKCVRNQFGEVDFQAEDLNRVMQEEKTLHEMTHPVLDLTKEGQQGIIFSASVAHAHLWAALLNRYRPGCAAAIDGETNKEERQHHVREYRSGTLQFLVNYGIFTEGFDAPGTKLIIMGRPTKSLLVYIQMLGRGTRPLAGLVDGVQTVEGRKDAIAGSLKPHVTVLDFVGNSRHQIVSATDVLGGNYDVDIRNLADDLLGDHKTGNVRDALTKAKAAMLLEQEQRRRQDIKFDSPGYQLQDVDPFGGAGVGVTQNHVRGGSTDGQIALLVNLGVEWGTAAGYSKRQAGAVIDTMRTKHCTRGQAKVLRKFGYNPDDFNVETASARIDQIAQNGWRKLA